MMLAGAGLERACELQLLTLTGLRTQGDVLLGGAGGLGLGRHLS